MNALLQERDFESIPIADIAARSALSIGSIYQRFGSKQNLLLKAYDIYIVEAVSEIGKLRADRGADNIEGDIRRLVDVISKLFEKHRGIVRSFLLMYRTSPLELEETHLQTVSSVFGDVDAFLISAGLTDNQARTCRDFVLANVREFYLFDAFAETSLSGRSQKINEVIVRAAMAVLPILETERIQ